MQNIFYKLPNLDIVAPLAHQPFKRIWLASLLSNLGLLINGVSAAWLMTRLSGEPRDVALIQTAIMLPSLFFSIVAGAIADTYDRRKVCLVMITFAICSSSALAGVSGAGFLTPILLLFLCFLMGTANALFGPAWQSSVAEQVPAEGLSSAVALNSISYNIARSFGPAVGGAVVAAFGATVAFLTSTLLYLPILAAMLSWRRAPDLSRLPPERIGLAIISGLRYILHSPVRTVILRTFLTGAAGAAMTALMPLIVHDLLLSGAATYGWLLAAFGLGAVFGAILVNSDDEGGSRERSFSANTVVFALAVFAIIFVRSLPLVMLVLVIAGAAWMQLMTRFNVLVQTQVPRWVAGRALAGFQAAASGGIALGSWLWGSIAQGHGLLIAFAGSGLMLCLLAASGRLMPMPDRISDQSPAKAIPSEPTVVLALSGKSGPIAVEIEYQVSHERAREFYNAITPFRRVRQRNGAFNWSISRDVASADVWIERYHLPTWDDYLRQRSRLTEVERGLSGEVEALLDRPPQVRRLLERPVGSVRWRTETPDHGTMMESTIL